MTELDYEIENLRIQQMYFEKQQNQIAYETLVSGKSMLTEVSSV